MNTQAFRTAASTQFFGAAAAVLMTVATLAGINNLATRGTSDEALLAQRSSLQWVGQVVAPKARLLALTRHLA